jgi:hypothetical protein
MDYLISILSNKRLLNLSLFFLRSWYLTWLVIAVLSYSILTYYNLDRGLFSIERLTYIHSSLFIKSFLYFRIVTDVVDIKSESFRLSKQWLERLSACFFMLFLFDAISIIAGPFLNTSKVSSRKFLEIIPVESVFYPIYSRIYLYIPAVFDFVHPHMEGTSLLILSIFLAYLSAKVNDEKF